MCISICSCICSCLLTCLSVRTFVRMHYVYVSLHDFNSNLSSNYNSYIRFSVLTLIIITVNDSKTITTVGNKSFSTRSLTPIIDRKDKKLVGKGTKMRIVKDFAKFPSSAIKIEKGKKITKKSSVSGDTENSVTMENEKFPNNVTVHSLVADQIENKKVLNEGEKEEQDELVQESINQVSMSTTRLNAPFKNDTNKTENSNSIINSENPLEKNINSINYELLKNEENADFNINNRTKIESIVHGKNKNEKENDDVNKNENEFISTLVNVEDENVPLLINHDKTTLLTNSVVTSSYQNILKSEIASNCMKNELFSTVYKFDNAITNGIKNEKEDENENENENKNLTLTTMNKSNFITNNTSDDFDKIEDDYTNEIDKENSKEMKNEKINQKNDNDSDNVKEMEEKNEDNFNNDLNSNSNNNNTNLNIETEKNSESIAISSIKKSVSTSINEPSRTFFNSHFPSNSNTNLNSNLNNLNLNNLNITSNNNNINLNNKRNDAVSLDQNEHNNIELNTVIDCPLVEGLGQEDAFKPRRSSIKVSFLF